MATDFIGELLADRPDMPPARIAYGVATAVNTVPIDGSATAVTLPAIRDVFTGQRAAVLIQGADKLILGPVANDWVEYTDAGAVTAATNYSVTSFRAYSNGFQAYFRLEVERTTADLVPAADGDVANHNVATLPTALQGSADWEQVLGAGGFIGRTHSAGYNPSNGLVRLLSLNNGEDLEIGDGLTIGGHVLLNP